MKYIGLKPIGRKPTVEILDDAHLYDLHNVADFAGHNFDKADRRLTLNWNFGCDCKGIISGPISLVFDGVANLKIHDKDIAIPRSEDLCLEEMHEISEDTLFFLFRGGESFTITCDSVSLDAKNTIGHKLRKE